MVFFCADVWGIRDFPVLGPADAEMKGGDDFFVFKADCFWATSLV